jgi:hypothetical protein
MYEFHYSMSKITNHNYDNCITYNYYKLTM